MPIGAVTLLPSFLGWLAEDGRLAVQVFLVIAGFLAAGSLAPDGMSRGAKPLSQVLRRYARLVMPYLVALIVSVLVEALIRPWLHDSAVPAAPDMAQLIAHGLLLQDLLGYPALSAGVWYIAIDFQLFVVAVMAIGVARRVQRRWSFGARQARWIVVVLVLLLAVASLALFNRQPTLDDTALYFFGAYGLGMLAFWVGRATQPGTWRIGIASLALLGVAALAIDWRSRIAIALVTALAITIIQRRAWPGPAVWTVLARPLLRMGRISYSLFLIHFPMILLVNAVVGTLWPKQPLVDLFGMVFAFGLSLVAATWLHRWVEMRAISWRAVAFLFGVLLACGALLSA
jgi:peptidoglycan/LPS O-acetylase OafA/YrhL